MRLAAPIATASLVLAGGCGDNGDSPPSRAPAVATEATADGNPLRVVARGARLGRGRENIRLLKIPRVGALLVSCDTEGLSSTALRLGDRTTSSDLVVERSGQVADAALDPRERFDPGFGGFQDGIETWRISFFAKAQAAIATITVGARQLGSENAKGCAISAEARVFRSAQGTLTR